ncbi:hypothetical protein DOE57_03675 [Salmonella enterica subsp. salamae serovar 56:b:[1,5]]|uniref:DUF1106 domain-containing protein n=2 Tax=Salmonella enterica TaxID=28901 RepID=A0A6C7CQ66_SALER|nr:hypothetical protein DOE57_03675 [Salmonella enterica subsp. salamae serovar 56:b:[1,5]]
MNNTVITQKNSIMTSLTPCEFNVDDREKHFHEMLNKCKWYEPDVVFLKLVELWKNKFYSPYLLRRFMLQKQRSFSLINGRLHGIILRIDTDGNNILLSLILNPNNIYHSLLYYREREISERLNQSFPLDNIIFSVTYETK